MPKIVIDEIASGYSLSKINDQFNKIETYINDKVMSRDSDGNANAMSEDLDMNSNQILNLPTPSAPTDPVRLQDIPNLVTAAQGANYVGETAPLTAFQGMRWYNPSLPATFVYYVDGDSGQWVEEAHEGIDGALRSDLQDVNSTVSIAGAAAKNLSRLYKSLVYVRDFKTTGVSDDAAVQAAVDYAFRDGYPREIVFEGDFSLTQQIGIPQLTFYTTSVNKFTGVGSAKINLSGMPANTALFTSAERKANPTAVADLYTGNLLFSGLAFEGNRTSSVVFDGDALYNVEVTGCIFKDLFKVAASGYAKPGYPGGYFQSMFFHHNRFTNIGNGTNGGIIYGGSGFNVTFNDNFCEAGNQGYGIYMFGGASQAMRFQNNVYEGSSKFLYASNMQGVISGNYFEGNHYGVNTTSSGIEIELFDIAASAVASTVTIQDNVCFAYPTGFSALVKYTGIQENNLSIIGNQIRRTDAYIYYSTNSRPGFYKNNSNHINLVTAPDTANRCYTIEGGSYRKAFNTYLPAAGTRNVVVNVKGGGSLRVKVSAVISGRADGVSCEYAVFGGVFATSAPKIVEVFKNDSDSGDLIQLGTVTSAAGKVTFPITTSAGSGGKVFVEVVGLAFEGATDEVGMTVADPDMCKIEVTI